MDTKASNRQKFKQNQRFNNKKNYIYKKKHGISKDTAFSDDEESEDSDVDNKFVKKTANDNSKRYEQEFEEDTEEYIQQKKLTKHLDDEEYKRQMKLQNSFIENEYKDKLSRSNGEYTEDDLMNMTTEQLNDLMLNKKSNITDTDFKSKLFKEKIVPVETVKKKKEPVKDSRLKNIPEIPTSIANNLDGSKKAPRKLRALNADESFLDALL